MPFRVYQNILAAQVHRQYVLVNITVQLPSSDEMRYRFARDSTIGDQRWILCRMQAFFRKMKIISLKFKIF